MILINIPSLGEQLVHKQGDSLMTTLVNGGAFVDNPCNGKGTCGKCKVEVLLGDVIPPCKEEKSLLGEPTLNNNLRLSCYIYPETSLTIGLVKQENKHTILTSGHVPEFSFRTAIKMVEASINKPTLHNQLDFETLMKEAFKVNSIDWNLLRKDINPGLPMVGIINDDKLVDLKLATDNSKIYGIAIDIGTTTIVAGLINLETGKEVATASMINPQKLYGLDVLTRITYAMENSKEGQLRLQTAIVDGISELIAELEMNTGIEKESLYEIVIAGNTTMLHFLLGIDSTVIGRSPYAPIFTKSKYLKANDLGIKASENTMLYCMPSVSSYIGSDIVAGSYVCALHKKEETTLFIDIGTNGEIVLAHKGRLVSCSCAAGPALEGMNISYGMRAQEGAIEELDISDKGIYTKVIGDVTGVGLCGSGILAVVREMIKTGIVTKKGAMIKHEAMEEDDYRRQYVKLNGKKREFHMGSSEVPVVVTQSDVRQVQLAKGAILSGFYALLNEVDISIEALDSVIVAGQFGAHLSVESLIGTGILPPSVRHKLAYVGNASKTGAYMALMSVDARREIEALAERMDYMELGATEGYERLFSKSLLFE